MRAREFVTEMRHGRITKRHQFGTRGLHLYGDSLKQNSNYTMNRVMMAAAATDGTFVPELDGRSWVGTAKTAHPYTEEEAEILKMAYKAAGARYKDLNKGDLESEEPPGGNDRSPVIAFRGYPR